MKEKPTLEYALDASGQQCITATHYLEHFDDDSVIPPRLHCPVCGESVIFARSHDRTHRPHFLHAAGSNAMCPLVNTGFPVTTFIRAYAQNPDVGRRHREAFAARWKLHLAEIRRYAPGFPVQRLIHTVEHADVLRIWSCPTLEPADVPYVLLVLASFLAQNAGASHPQSWLRFFFDASVAEVADLRKPGRIAPRFYRLHYRASHGSMFPDASHLIDWNEVRMSANFLDLDTPLLPPSDTGLFTRFIEAEPIIEEIPTDSIGDH